jgi:hypothetical protein
VNSNTRLDLRPARSTLMSLDLSDVPPTALVPNQYHASAAATEYTSLDSSANTMQPIQAAEPTSAPGVPAPVEPPGTLALGRNNSY